MAAGSKTAVVIFAFSRPAHLEALLVSLARNEEFADLPVLVHIDGPRGSDEAAAVDAVAEVAVRYVGEAHVVQSRVNLGLRTSIVGGVGRVLERYEQVIVLEDDLVVSRYFLKFMLDGLARYSGDSRVASIHGYRLPGTPFGGNIFLRGADCWGWATWRESWTHYRDNASELLDELLRSEMTFDYTFGGYAPHLKLLAAASSGSSDSWAIRWHTSVYLMNKLTLYPEISLVRNQGHDGSGTNTPSTSAYDVPLADWPVFVNQIPISVSAVGWKAYSTFYRKRKMAKQTKLFVARAKTVVRESLATLSNQATISSR